jgi:hypothetical protein
MHALRQLVDSVWRSRLAHVAWRAHGAVYGHRLYMTARQQHGEARAMGAEARLRAALWCLEQENDVARALQLCREAVKMSASGCAPHQQLIQGITLLDQVLAAAEGETVILPSDFPPARLESLRQKQAR